MTFFTADDFEAMAAWRPETLAQHCNAKLAREAKVVYGLKSTKLGDEFYFSEHKDDADTHRALLICVEEIERKPCEHEVGFSTANPKLLLSDQQVFMCCKCSKKIKLKWEWEQVNG